MLRVGQTFDQRIGLSDTLVCLFWVRVCASLKMGIAEGKLETTTTKEKSRREKTRFENKNQEKRKKKMNERDCGFGFETGLKQSGLG